MARLRNFVCYRDYKRPYTRYSKFKKFSYVKSRPANRIARYTGGMQEDFPVKIHLVCKSKFMQVRDNAIESARQTCIRHMAAFGKTGYFFQIRIFPHHILRENPLASGAGADRLSTGMAHNFGKSIGIAAQVRANQEIFTVWTSRERIPVVRTAMKKAAYKLPFKCTVTVEDMEAKKKVEAKKKAVKAAKAAEANKKVTEKPKTKVAEKPKTEIAEVPKKELVEAKTAEKPAEVKQE